MGCEAFSDKGVYDAHARAVAGCCPTPYAIARGTGKGTIRSVCFRSGLSVYAHSMRFNKDVSFADDARRDAILFGFCLGDGVTWQSSKQSMTIDQGGYYVQAGFSSDSIEYLAGARYRFLCISLSKRAAEDLIGDDASRVEKAIPSGRPLLRSETTPRMKALLEQIEAEPYDYALSGIYRYGKACEIIAEALSDVVSPSRRAVVISRTDRIAIAAAKRILEERYAHPPTYPELAREVCMSESKLSRGFREVYGTTIHSYVVSLRLEAALRLFREGDMGVSEVACRVGYSNPSHFSEAFKKRFGILPKEARASCSIGFGLNDTGIGL